VLRALLGVFAAPRALCSDRHRCGGFGQADPATRHALSSMIRRRLQIGFVGEEMKKASD
jgi:hypothetical protein